MTHLATEKKELNILFVTHSRTQNHKISQAVVSTYISLSLILYRFSKHVEILIRALVDNIITY